MKELPYTDLRFQKAPVRKRIFWSVLAGLITAYFLGDPNLVHYFDPDYHWPGTDGFRIGQGSLLHIEIPLRISFFFCGALLVHLILLLTQAPRFQFSLIRLFIATLFFALFLSANLLVYGQEGATGNVFTISKYGWPLPLCSVIHFNGGNSLFTWHTPYCVLAATFLLLSILNILFFKLPQPAKREPAHGVKSEEHIPSKL